MIDCISAYTVISPNYLNKTTEEWRKMRDEDWDVLGTIKLGRLSLVENRCPKDAHVKNFRCEKDSLLFVLTPNKLIISNSLHKHFKGDNYSDFSYSELLESIKRIEELTGTMAEEFHITKFELAINIETTKRPCEYLDCFGTYKNREYDKMRTKGFWYGNKYNFSEYSLKIYDKSEESKRQEKQSLGKNILRFEIQYKKLRKTSLIKTLADFRDREKLSTIFNTFLATVKQVNYIDEEDFSEISPRERELYYAGQNPRFWMAEKRENRETEKSKRKRFKEIQQKDNFSDWKEMFIKALEEKINQLFKS
jgi:hypothetical protein